MVQTTKNLKLHWQHWHSYIKPLGMDPYRWFRYTLLVPTVARVHFLSLKALVFILIFMGSTWYIGTKYRYVIPHGFGSQMCTLTIPTICTIDTVTKVVGRIKQWRDCRTNNGVRAGWAVKKLGGNGKNPDATHIAPKIHIHTMTLLLPPPPPPCAHCRLHIPPPPPPLLFLPPPFPPDFCSPQFGAGKCRSTWNQPKE